MGHSETITVVEYEETLLSSFMLKEFKDIGFDVWLQIDMKHREKLKRKIE